MLRAVTVPWDIYYHLRFPYAIRGLGKIYNFLHCWILHQWRQLAYTICTVKLLFQFQQPEEIRRAALPWGKIQQIRVATEQQHYSKTTLTNMYKIAIKNTKHSEMHYQSDIQSLECWPLISLLAASTSSNILICISHTCSPPAIPSTLLLFRWGNGFNPKSSN